MSNIFFETMRQFNDCHAQINCNNELVLNAKTNIWFRLEGVETEFDFKCKLLEHVSRDCCKTEPYKTRWKNSIYQGDNLVRLNNILETHFTPADMMLIYTHLGNGCNRSLCEKFVKSGYDLELLEVQNETE